MKRIISYKMVFGQMSLDDQQIFNTRVESLIEAGYEPYGNPIFDYPNFGQAFVFRREDK